MPTVIDSLVVSLSLDPTKFTQGQKDALNALRNLEDGTHKHTVGVEESAKRMGNAFGGIKSQVLELFAAYTGGKGVLDFVTDLTTADAAVGKVSRATGVSVAELSKWQGVARITGGSAQDMAASFKQVSDVFTAWHVGGPEAPAIMQILSRITQEAQRLDGANAKIFDTSKGQGQFFKDLADNLLIIHDLDEDKNLSSYLSGKVGIGADLFDVLSRGAGGAQKLLDIVEKLGHATKESSDAATELERRWNAIFSRSEGAGRQAGIIPQILNTSDLLNKPAGEAMGEIGADLKRRYQERGIFGAWWDALTFQGGQEPSYKKIYGDPSGGSLSGGGQPGGAFTSQAQKEAFIRAEALKRGIDPNIAMAVARSEGFNTFKSSIPGENSYGAFQLNVTPGGRGGNQGDLFRRATGLDPSDQKNEAAGILWALDDIKKTGWQHYHGAANGAHIGPWTGIDRGAPGGGSSPIVFNGPITVTGVRDATDFTNKLRDLGLKRQADASQSPVGGQ